MMSDHRTDDIAIRIDMIIRGALLTTSNEQESDPRKVYTEVRLYKLVLEPILAMCTDNVDTSTLHLLASKVGYLGRCTKSIRPYKNFYLCTDCASYGTVRLCKDCYISCVHFGHSYVSSTEKIECVCHCGDNESCGNSRPCSNHDIPNDRINLPKFYVERIKIIMRHFFKYLELICCDESSYDANFLNGWQINDYFKKLNIQDKSAGLKPDVEKKDDSKNADKWCLLIFRTEDEDPEHAELCLNFAIPHATTSGYSFEFLFKGYLCVKYRDTFENCQASCVNIENFIKNHIPGSGLHCRVIKMHRLFFMKVSGCLIKLISDMCFNKSIFCDMMSEMVFKDTSLPEKFFFTRSLWTEIRNGLAYSVFLPTLFSRMNGRNLVNFFLKNFELLYTELLMSSPLRKYLFRLSYHIVTPKKELEYLIKNGFLCRILDFIADRLKNFGYGTGLSISKVLEQIGLSKMDPFYYVADHFTEILYFVANNIDDSVQMRSELKKTAVRLVQFFFDFDDMEPVTLIKEYIHERIHPKEASELILHLQHIFVPYLIIMVKYEDVTNVLFHEYLRVFRRDIGKLTANLTKQEAIEKLLTLHFIYE
ncbi:hypothetical protein RF11_14145 [Thelohanellus kitauei]|uniref:UBR-type domain-containing protein n=1 Tax=Thelohanellus kitauei TaxID=669202 RepID=A0A0C2I9P7_THEKT|nr:hypothetical protein RF11_14145 [Thelohanellus kitauei]